MSGTLSSRISITCAVITLCGSLITILGWAIGEPAFTDWLGSGISMLPNTAIAMSAAGLALLLRNRAHRLPAMMFAGFSGLIGLATFFEHLLSIDLGIDQLVLSSDWGQHGTIAPGRIGPPASLMFVLLNIALALTMFGRNARQWAALGATIAIGICSISLIGFLYGSASFYDIPKWTAISINTALLFTILAIGVITVLPDVQPMLTLLAKSATGALVRRALPLVVAVPLLIGWLRIRSAELEAFDSAFGITLRTIVEVILLVSLLAWMAKAVSLHERSLRLSEEQLREAVMMRLNQRVVIEQQSAMRQQLARHLIDSVQIDLPEKLTAQQAERNIQSRRFELMYQGVDAEEIDKQMDELRRSGTDAAHKELKLFFILGSAAMDRKVPVNEQEVNGRIAQMAAESGQRPEQLRAELLRTGRVQAIAQQIREHKTLDLLLSEVKMVDMPLDEFNEWMTEQLAADSK